MTIAEIKKCLSENGLASMVSGFTSEQIGLWKRCYQKGTGDDWNKTREIEFWQKAEKICIEWKKISNTTEAV